MALGNNEHRRFCGISKGKVTERLKDQERKFYDYIEGRITGIKRRDVTINNEPLKVYDFEMSDNGEKFVLSISMSGSIARGIILCLANIKDFANTTVRINPYVPKDKPDMTNVAVYANGQKLSWFTTDFPAVKEIVAGSKTYKDDSDRIAFVEGVVDEINRNITASYAAGSGMGASQPAVDYDMEEDIAPAPDDDMPGDNGIPNFLNNGAPQPRKF